jgi:hypothetical protein
MGHVRDYVVPWFSPGRLPQVMIQLEATVRGQSRPGRRVGHGQASSDMARHRECPPTRPTYMLVGACLGDDQNDDW